MCRREGQEKARTGPFLRIVGFGGSAAKILLIRAKSSEVDSLPVWNDARGKRQPSVFHEGEGASVISERDIDPRVVVARGGKGA